MSRVSLFSLFFAFVALVLSVQASPTLHKRTSRTSPPSGTVIVRGSGTKSGEFSTVQAAVNSLDATSTKVIFIYPGTYNEQVTITRSGKLTIYGSTSDTSSYASNTVTITHGLSAASAGNDKASATLIVDSANFSLYNVNLKNSFGQGSQALAVAAYGTQQGYYGVGFYGWQDTVLAEQGNQFYGHCYIEGAVDFIFGQHARAFFNKVDIASVGAGAITADGPSSASDNSLFVIYKSTVKQSVNAASSLTQKVFLGRPWTQWARVAFLNTDLSSIINPAGWEQWSSSTPNTANVQFVEGGNTGAGASGTRASFSEKVSSTSGYTAADVLGSSWTSWVDQSYV